MTVRTLLKGGWLLDEDGTTRQHLDVCVEDGLIVEVGTDLRASENEVVDCAGSTVMPGLIDAHVHLAMAGSAEPDSTREQSEMRVASNAKDLLAAGVTTARDVSGPSDLLLEQRKRCAEDPAAGPQLLLSCEGIACVGGHGTEFRGAAVVTEVDGPESAREAVRRLSRIGADWVKVMLNGANEEVELSDDELRAIVEEARAARIPVAAHASNPKAVALAVRCGVDSIEHGQGIDDQLAKEMSAAGIALVTTTFIYRAGAGCTHRHGAVDYIAAFDPSVQEQVRSIMAMRVAAHEKAIPAVLRAGVKVVLGTDAVVGPIGLVAHELEALTVLGLSPAQALTAATVAGAELLGLSDRGRVAVGLRADLVVVRARPDEDLSSIARPNLVMRGGVLVA